MQHVVHQVQTNALFVPSNEDGVKPFNHVTFVADAHADVRFMYKALVTWPHEGKHVLAVPEAPVANGTIGANILLLVGVDYAQRFGVDNGDVSTDISSGPPSIIPSRQDWGMAYPSRALG